MFFDALLAACFMAAASTQSPVSAHPAHAVARDNAIIVPAEPGAVAGVPAPPAIGADAPDFTYQSHDYLWQNLHHMLNQGNVLLVFGATDAQLMGLERDRDALLHAGVVPVGVICQRENEVWRVVRRCSITYSLLSDPHASIAEQFGSVDATTRRAVPAWFLIDPAGRVRAAGRELPAPSEWLSVASRALGLTDVSTTASR